MCFLIYKKLISAVRHQQKKCCSGITIKHLRFLFLNDTDCKDLILGIMMLKYIFNLEFKSTFSIIIGICTKPKSQVQAV